jgi:hypothetical protein
MNHELGQSASHTTVPMNYVLGQFSRSTVSMNHVFGQFSRSTVSMNNVFGQFSHSTVPMNNVLGQFSRSTVSMNNVLGQLNHSVVPKNQAFGQVSHTCSHLNSIKLIFKLSSVYAQINKVVPTTRRTKENFAHTSCFQHQYYTTHKFHLF